MSTETQTKVSNKNSKITKESISGPINYRVTNGYPIVKNSNKESCEFVTSSTIYKEKEVKEKEALNTKRKKYSSAKLAKQNEFIITLSNHTRCIMYIEDYLKSGNKLAKKYSYNNVVNELGTIHNNHKLDFIRVKIFEILLTLSATDRTSLMFNKDHDSKLLRDIWMNYAESFRNYISSWRLDNGKKIDL